MLPVRVTVKVKAVLPLLPSFRLALAAAIDSDGPAAVSSLRMVPVAVAVPMVVPALGLDSVSVKPSVDSTAVSPATLTVMVLLVSPAAKLTVPVGNTAAGEVGRRGRVGAAAGHRVAGASRRPSCCRCASPCR